MRRDLHIILQPSLPRYTFDLIRKQIVDNADNHTVNDRKHQSPKCLAENGHSNFAVGYRSHEGRAEVMLQSVENRIQENAAFSIGSVL